jgi:ERCC4-related helicase
LKVFFWPYLQVLVATDVCARGIDIPNVAMVVNFDMPNQVMLFLMCVQMWCEGSTAARRRGCVGSLIVGSSPLYPRVSLNFLLYLRSYEVYLI